VSHANQELSSWKNVLLVFISGIQLFYFIIVSESFIFCISNSQIKFSINCIPLTLLFHSYSFFKKSQITLVVFSVIILVKIEDETAVNKLALASFFFFFLPLFIFFIYASVGLFSRGGTFRTPVKQLLIGH
jgi:hypothetical protein